VARAGYQSIHNPNVRRRTATVLRVAVLGALRLGRRFGRREQRREGKRKRERRKARGKEKERKTVGGLIYYTNDTIKAFEFV
jgi:hypothetical protein